MTNTNQYESFDDLLTDAEDVITSLPVMPVQETRDDLEEIFLVPMDLAV